MRGFPTVLVDDLSLGSNGSKFPQVSRTLLSVLANPNNTVIWMISINPLISNPFSPPSKFLGTVLSPPVTCYITIILMLHCFLSSLARSKCLFHFSLFTFLFSIRGPLERQNLLFGKFSLFFFFFVNYH